MNKESKLVEALQSFMNNSVLPCLPKDHTAASEWRFLSGILTGRPIDYNQLDFYLLMANKSSPSTPPSQPELQKQIRSFGDVDSPTLKRGIAPPRLERKDTGPKRY